MSPEEFFGFIWWSWCMLLAMGIIVGVPFGIVYLLVT